MSSERDCLLPQTAVARLLKRRLSVCWSDNRVNRGGGAAAGGLKSICQSSVVRRSPRFWSGIYRLVHPKAANLYSLPLLYWGSDNKLTSVHRKESVQC